MKLSGGNKLFQLTVSVEEYLILIPAGPNQGVWDVVTEYYAKCEDTNTATLLVANDKGTIPWTFKALQQL